MHVAFFFFFFFLQQLGINSPQASDGNLQGINQQAVLEGQYTHVKLRLHGTRQAARLRRDSRAANIET